jgi:hypothetical protein
MAVKVNILKKFLYLIIPLLFLLVGCAKPIKNYKLYYHESSYNVNHPIIVRSKNQLLNISDYVLINKYDDDYFLNNELIVLSHTFSSVGGYESFSVTKLEIKKSIIYLNLRALYTEEEIKNVTYIVYIEIPKINANEVILTTLETKPSR